MGFIKNLPQALQGVDLQFAKVRQMSAEAYRRFVWDVFLRILRETPQWSGKAVANWNLSVGKPDFEMYVKEGDEGTLEGKRPGDLARSVAAHEKGDERWMRVARNRARPVMNSIRTGDKVFISNGVRGDGDGVGAELYLQALQNPGYWAYKLREVNKPYEVAQESVVVVAMQAGRRGFFAPRVGGESWKQE